MSSTCGKIGYDRDYIDSIISSLDTLDDNIDFIISALNSLTQYIENNQMSGVEVVLQDDIDNLINYFEVDYRNIIETSRTNISDMSDSVEDLDTEIRNGVTNGL